MSYIYDVSHLRVKGLFYIWIYSICTLLSSHLWRFERKKGLILNLIILLLLFSFLWLFILFAGYGLPPLRIVTNSMQQSINSCRKQRNFFRYLTSNSRRFAVISNRKRSLSFYFWLSFASNPFFCGATVQVGSRPPRCWEFYITHNQTHIQTHAR